jgi:hypothetical protein
MDEHPLTQKMTFQVFWDLPSTLSVIEETLNSMEARDVTRRSNAVKGATPMSWRSFGQTVLVVVQPSNDGSCECSCSCWPKVDHTVVDWGAGRLALERLFLAVQKIATHAGIAEPRRLGSETQFGLNQATYFDTLAKEPPDLETSKREVRKMLANVLQSDTLDPSTKSEAHQAIALLDSGHITHAVTIISRVVDTLRSYPSTDPARNIVLSDVDVMVRTLSHCSDS